MTATARKLRSQLEPDPRDVVPMGDLRTEGALLSALLCDDEPGRYWTACAPLLRAEMFYAHANQHVYEAIERQRGAGKQADAVSVCRVMGQLGTLAKSGGHLYVAETLALTQPAVAHPQVFAAEIAELWKQRELCRVMNKVAVKMRHGELQHEDARIELREHFKAVKA